MAFRSNNSVSNGGGRPARSVGKASLLLLLLALFSAAALLGGLQRGSSHREGGLDEGYPKRVRKRDETEDVDNRIATKGGRNPSPHADENSSEFDKQKTIVEHANSKLVGGGTTGIEVEKGQPVTHRQLGKGYRVEVEEHERDALEESGGRLSHSLSDDNSGSASLGWRGTECIAGGELTHKKLLSNCRKGRVEKRWCERINRNLEALKRVRENEVTEQGEAKGNAYSPLCGQYVSGRFGSAGGPSHVEGSQEGVSQAVLEATRQSLVDRIARTHVKAHQCNTPATFGGVVEKGTVYFERVVGDNPPPSHEEEGDPAVVAGRSTSVFTHNNGQPYVLKSRVCNAFSYLPNGASIASVLHYHAAVAGQPHERRGILFTGDSMMRQIFLSLIGSIRDGRGQPSSGQAGTATEEDDGMPMDHFFHMDALYVFRSDGDELIILDDARKQETRVRKLLSHWFPGYLREDQQANEDARGQETDVHFAMLYLWDITPSTHRPEPFKMHSLSLHIGAFMYWWNNKGQLSELEPYLANMSAHLDNNRQQTFIHVTTPWTRPETFGGVVDAVRTPRNRRMATWVDDERYLAEKKFREKGSLLTDQTATAGGSRLGLRQRWLLDFSGIADSNTVDGPISKTPDNIHYGCIWQPKYPQAITGMKDNGMGCKDPMNAAVGQWLLALLLRI